MKSAFEKLFSRIYAVQTKDTGPYTHAIEDGLHVFRDRRGKPKLICGEAFFGALKSYDWRKKR